MRRTLLLLSLLIITAPAESQNLQYSRKTVLFHEAGYWCADDYSSWCTGLYDTLCSLQNTTAFPAFYAEYDPACTADTPCTELFYAPSAGLSSNEQPHWLNRPQMHVNGYGVLMDPLLYPDYDAGSSMHIYRRACDTFSYYVAQETLAPNKTAIGISDTMLSADSVMICTRIKFLADVPDVYRVAVYILEDSAMGYTNNGSTYGEQMHRFRIRYASYDYIFGLYTCDHALAGEEFLDTFSKKIPPEWNISHLSYLAIAYHYDGSSSRYFIDNATKGADAAEAVTPIANHKIDASLYPNPAREQLFLSYQFPAAGCDTKIYLSDLCGKQYGLLYKGSVPGMNGTLPLPLPAGLSAGLYFLTISNSYGSLVKPLSIEP